MLGACREVDVNNDGVLQFDEFCELLQKVPICNASFSVLSLLIALLCKYPCSVTPQMRDSQYPKKRTDKALVDMGAPDESTTSFVISEAMARRMFIDAIALSETGHVNEATFIKVAHCKWTKVGCKVAAIQ